MRRLYLVLWAISAGASSLPEAKADPNWWSPVIHNGDPVNNYAPANLGQLKNFADRAADHLDAKLSGVGGRGAVIRNMINSWGSGGGPSNYSPANLGQLKYVLDRFYTRLDAVGFNYKQQLEGNTFTGTWTLAPNGGLRPWNESAAVSGNYAPVNLGQMKLLFSFDLTGFTSVDSNANEIPDSWEIAHNIPLVLANVNTDGNADTDGDGVSDYEEYELNLDPNSPNDGGVDSDGDGIDNANDAFPSDPRRQFDVPSMQFAAIDISEDQTDGNDVALVGSDDDNQFAFAYKNPSGTQVTAKTWNAGLVATAQSVYLPYTYDEEGNNGERIAPQYLTSTGTIYGHYNGYIDSNLNGGFTANGGNIVWQKSDSFEVTNDYQLRSNGNGWVFGGVAGGWGGMDGPPENYFSTNGDWNGLIRKSSTILFYPHGLAPTGTIPVTAAVESPESLVGAFLPNMVNSNGWAIGYSTSVAPWTKYIWTGSGFVNAGAVLSSGYITSINDQNQAVVSNGGTEEGRLWTISASQRIVDLLPEIYRKQIRNIAPLQITNPEGNAVKIEFSAQSLEGRGQGGWVNGKFILTVINGSEENSLSKVAAQSAQVFEGVPSGKLNKYGIYADRAKRVISASGSSIAPSAQKYHALPLVPCELISDLNNDGVITDEDRAIKADSTKIGATFFQTEKAREYLFANDDLSNGLWDKEDINDPNLPSTAKEDDDAEELHISGAVPGMVVWFNHPAIDKIFFYKTRECSPGDKITFPFAVSAANPLPSKLFVRAEGSFPAQVEGNLELNIGKDQNTPYASDKLKLTIVSELGQTRFFEAARDYILERNTRHFIFNVKLGTGFKATMVVFREEATTMKALDTYWRDPKLKFIDEVVSAYPAASIITNANFVFDPQYISVLPPSRMTRRCHGRLFTGGALNTDVSSDNADENYPPGNPDLRGSVYAGPEGKYVSMLSPHNFVIDKGQVPLSPAPSEALGGFHTNYDVGNSNHMMIGLTKTKLNYRLLFIIQNTEINLQDIATAVKKSGVPSLPHGQSDDFMIVGDAGTSQALAYKNADDQLTTYIKGNKHRFPTGNYYTINTYLSFESEKARP
jgi:hypothetical protein